MQAAHGMPQEKFSALRYRYQQIYLAQENTCTLPCWSETYFAAVACVHFSQPYIRCKPHIHNVEPFFLRETNTRYQGKKLLWLHDARCNNHAGLKNHYGCMIPGATIIPGAKYNVATAGIKGPPVTPHLFLFFSHSQSRVQDQHNISWLRFGAIANFR
jgi:hypothetical protein